MLKKRRKVFVTQALSAMISSLYEAINQVSLSSLVMEGHSLCFFFLS